MEGPDEVLGFGPGSDPVPPSLVHLAQFSPIPQPSARRLSSHFARPSRPVQSARRLAYVSLQGRLVNAEEASSARGICGGRSGGRGLGEEETVAWELFTPIQRFLIVAVIGVAVAESKKNRVIRQLKKSVDLRDQVLTNMQQKLDDLCEQLSNIKDQSGCGSKISDNMNMESQFRESFGSDKIKFNDCGCWLCDQHLHHLPGLGDKPLKKVSLGHEMLNRITNLGINSEHEERRMSDLSDWCSSVTSATEIQINNLAIDQDVYDLKKECQEKDATINELTLVLQSANKAGSKRISDLEENIRRKNMIITRLKKDVMVLEQKVSHLTRQRRPSSSGANSKFKLPVMMDNLLYDMDSATSPSTSDSDTPSMNEPRASIDKLLQVEPVKDLDSNSAKTQKPEPVEPWAFDLKATDCNVRSRSVSPLKEQSSRPEPVKYSVSDAKATDLCVKSRSVSPLDKPSANRKPGSVYALRRRRVSSSSGDLKSGRRPVQTGSAGSRKRWV